jgi:O-antigen/teichoic acid export membrane protein
MNGKSWSFLDTSIERSFAWSLALTILPVIASFVVSWVIARWSGPVVWGTVSWTMAFATALLIVGKMGFCVGASRLASELGVKRPGALRALFTTALAMRAVTTIAVAALSFAFAAPVAGWFHDGALVWPIRIASAILICASFFEFQEQYLIGLNRHDVVSRTRSLMLALRIVLTAMVVGMGWGAASVLSGYVLAWVVGIAVFGVLIHRRLPPATEGEPRSALRRRLLAISVPLAVSGASVTVFTQMDKLMLGYFDKVHEVGQYSIARAVTEVSLFPAFAFVTMLRPALASRFSSGRLDECARLIRNSLRLSLVSGVLFASVLAVMAVPLLTLVYSSEFRYAGELMVLFVWVIALRSLGALVLPALVAAEKTRLYAYLTTFSALVNFVLNLLLIPRYHARGAVLATIVSYALLLVAGLRQVFTIFKVRVGWRGVSMAARTVLAGVAAGSILWIILERSPDPGWGVVLWGIVQTVVYVFLVMAFGVIRTADVRQMLGNLLKINK